MNSCRLSRETSERISKSKAAGDRDLIRLKNVSSIGKGQTALPSGCRDLQSPSRDSEFSCLWNWLCEWPAAFSNLRVDFFEVVSCSAASTANRVSTPGRVGKKKGAFSGAFGGSFGLLRCYAEGQKGSYIQHRGAHLYHF